MKMCLLLPMQLQSPLIDKVATPFTLFIQIFWGTSLHEATFGPAFEYLTRLPILAHQMRKSVQQALHRHQQPLAVHLCVEFFGRDAGADNVGADGV